MWPRGGEKGTQGHRAGPGKPGRAAPRPFPGRLSRPHKGARSRHTTRFEAPRLPSPPLSRIPSFPPSIRSPAVGSLIQLSTESVFFASGPESPLQIEFP
jgi:hypothetical protein